VLNPSDFVVPIACNIVILQYYDVIGELKLFF
jgi:hypothetical protein